MNIDVFISHSSKDAKIANAICNTLEANNIRCWLAPRDIRPGSDWAESINNAIESSKSLVLVFSENSNNSTQVAKELNLAINNKLIVLPFKIDDSTPTGSMKYYLSDTHWLDAINGDIKDEIENLKDVLISVLPKKLAKENIGNLENCSKTANADKLQSDSAEENSSRLDNPDNESANKSSVQKSWILSSIAIVLILLAVAFIFTRNSSNDINLIDESLSPYYTEWANEQIELGDWTVPYKNTVNNVSSGSLSPITCSNINLEIEITDVQSGNPYGEWRVYTRALDGSWNEVATVDYPEQVEKFNFEIDFASPISFDAIGLSRISADESIHNYDFNIVSYEKPNIPSTLKIGYTRFSPVAYYDVNDDFVGFDVELAKHICDNLGITPEFIEISWDMKEDLISNGEIDCVWNALVDTEYRRQTMSCTEPYLLVQTDEGTQEGWIVAFNKNNNELASLINSELATAKEDGTIERLSKKYPIQVAN